MFWFLVLAFNSTALVHSYCSYECCFQSQKADVFSKKSSLYAACLASNSDQTKLATSYILGHLKLKSQIFTSAVVGDQFRAKRRVHVGLNHKINANVSLCLLNVNNVNKQLSVNTFAISALWSDNMSVVNIQLAALPPSGQKIHEYRLKSFKAWL